MEKITSPTLTGSAAEKVSGIYGSFDFEDIVSEITSGSFNLKTEGFLNRVFSIFAGELKGAFSLLGILISLMLVSALFNNLQESFGKKSVSTAARFSCYVYLITACASVFQTASGYVMTVLEDISVLIKSLVPSMAVLCASGGSVMLAGTHPVIFFICNAVSWIIKNIITPLVFLRATTVFLCGITQNDGMEEFSALFQKAHKMLLALSMTLFSGMLAISRFAALSFDSLAARGIKFAVSATVPVVGGSLAEAMSSVAGSAMLLKNAVGIAGVLMIFAIFSVPLIKLAALSFVYRITAALAAPVADAKIISTLKKSGECIEMLFSSIACMGIIMVIAVAALL